MELGDPQDFDRVLSSMCTVPHPAARDAAERFLDSNAGDPGTYQTVASLEDRAVELLGTIADLENPAGYITSGGSEANIQAIRIARNRGETNQPNIVAPASAHFSFRKAAEMLNVEFRSVETTDFRADVDAMADAVDSDTVGIIGVAGTTEYGRVDPIVALGDLAEDAGALLHVDAAFGGFLLPFTDFEWNFDHASVDTMTIDPHKMGRAAIPAGGFLARETDLLDELAIETPYLESKSQVTLTGTRSGGGIASAVAAMEAQWPDGYREQYHTSMDNANWLADEFRDRGYDVVDPELPIVAVDVSLALVEELRERGWRVTKTGHDELRIVFMPHVTRSILQAFVADMDWY